MAPRIHSHRITVCTVCRHTGTHCQPGAALIEKLNAAVFSAGLVSNGDFKIEGTACMAGCSRPCTVAFSATGKTTYLFGDIHGDEDVEALINFARLYSARADGMSHSPERPAQLRNKTLARVPAAIIETRELAESLQ